MPVEVGVKQPGASYSVNSATSHQTLNDYKNSSTGKAIMGALNFMSSYIKPEQISNYATHLTSVCKNDLVQSVDYSKLNDKKKALMKKLISVGGDIAPVIFKYRAECPELFEATEAEEQTIDLVGFNGTLNKKEKNDLISMIRGLPLVRRYGPFTDARGINMSIIPAAYGMESIISDLSYDERKEMADKLAETNEGLESRLHYDPRMDVDLGVQRIQA
ncbi:MAG: hypothetical protein WC307_04290 [Candidatus Nanoarchaeia archaeon]|jgi:hypothetical protein